MAESPIYLFTIDLLCREICQGHMDMMVLANSGLLMMLQPCLARQIVRVALTTYTTI